MKMEEQRYIVCSHFADSTSYAVPKQLTNLSFCTVLHTYSDRCNRPGAARVQKSGGLPQWVSLRRQCIGSISWQGSNVDTSCWTSTENRTSPPLMFGKIPPLNCRFLRDQLRSTFNQRCYNAYTRERERERENFWCFQGQPFLCLCKEALPLRNGHGRCQRSPKLFAQHIWSLETLDEDIASGWCRSMCGTCFFLKGPCKAEPRFNALYTQGMQFSVQSSCWRTSHTPRLRSQRKSWRRL